MPDGRVEGVLRPYRLLGTIPHAKSLMTASIVGRLYMPAVPLVITFLIVDWTGSYGIGGVVVGALTVGQGVAGPLRGRTADRSSAPKLLLITGACYGTGLCLLGLLAGPVDPALWWLILPIAFGTGLSMPPVTQLGRSIWPRIAAEQPARDAAYAVEATLQELMFVVAPIVAAMGVAFVGPLPAILVCAAWAAGGAVLYAFVLGRAGLRFVSSTGSTPTTAGSTRNARGLLRTPGMLRLLVFGLFVVGALIGTDLILVSWARERGTPGLAGILAAVWAGGSLIGGLLVGGSSKPPRLWLRAGLTAAGMFLLVPVLPPIADPASPLLVCAVLLVGGTAVAPTLAAVSGALSDVAPEDRRTEAFGWFTTANTSGGALASPLVGGLLDVAGPAVAAAMTGTFALIGALLVRTVGRRGSRTADSAGREVAA